MKHTISFFLIVIFFCSPVMAATPENAVLVKHGIINSAEEWSGLIHIVGDVKIQKDVTVTVKAGSTLMFSSYDVKNLGEDPDKPELIVDGTLDVEADATNPVLIKSQDKLDSYEKLALDNNTSVITFKPYEVQTENLRKEFNAFKLEYYIFWTVVYGMWILR